MQAVQCLFSHVEEVEREDCSLRHSLKQFEEIAEELFIGYPQHNRQTYSTLPLV